MELTAIDFVLLRFVPNFSLIFRWTSFLKKNLSLQSGVIILRASHCAAGHGSVCGSKALIGPSIFSLVVLGGAMRGPSPEDAPTTLHSGTSVQSQMLALNNQYLHTPHTRPTGEYYGNICMKKKSMQSAIQYFQNTSTVVVSSVKHTC